VRLPLLAALVGFACSKPAKIPLEYRPNDIAIVGARIDGEFTVQVVPYATGEPIEVDADEGTAVFTWVLTPEDFVDPGGGALGATTLAAVGARAGGTAPDGSCGRCLAPSRDAPQVVNAGDSCRIPPFVRGAVWQPSEGGFVCSGASESPICSTGPEGDQKLIEATRRELVLDWPGACACTGEQPAETLDGVEVRALSPVAAPIPINTYAQDQEGRIAGFSREAAILFDPVQGTSSMITIDDWPVSVTQAIALADGSGFLVASEEFNTGYFDAYRFDRFTVAGGELVGPEPVTSDHVARPYAMKYLGDHPDLPFYLIGSLRGNLGSFEAAMFACTDRTVACQQVNLGDCPDERGLDLAIDAQILPDGSGFALANHAFFYKDPNSAPIANPHPADAWKCAQDATNTWNIRGGGTLKVSDFAALGRAEDRIFVCAHASVPDCMPYAAVVLSATVTSSAGAVVEPEWEVVYQGYDWSRCRGFMRVPGQPSQTRLRISGQVLIDFDRDGNVLEESNIGTKYGDVPGLVWIEDLADGYTLLESNESQAFLKEDAQDGLTRFYGGEDRALATYNGAVAIGEGDFLVFGHPQGILRLRVLESTDGFPSTDLRLLADPTGVLAEGGALRDAVIDAKETAAAGRPVVLIAGERGGNTLLLRAVIGDGEVERGTTLSTPASVEGLGAVRIGEAAPGQFVIGLEGTRLLRAVDDVVTELEIDFDDPDTEAVEARPVLGADRCSGDTPRLDAWRDIAGNNGVVWVLGAYQLVFRVTGDRVERFIGSPSAEYSSMLLTCPDRAVFAGRGTSVDLAGIERVTMQFWSIDPIEFDPNEEISLTLRREQALREIASDQVNAIGIGYLQGGYPRAILPDATGGRGDPEHLPFAAVLHNGHIARFFAAEGLVEERPPFYPEVAVQSPGGYVLYGGYDSRLALGVPRSKR
jgi:hypothetical protein